MSVETRQPIDTRSVADRRELKFESLDDALADAEKLAAGQFWQLGNWSLGQALEHLAKSMNFSIDGGPQTAPWTLRVVGRLFRNRFLNRPMPAGYKFPANLAPHFAPADEVSVEDGWQQIRRAVERQKTETRRSPNPFLGRLTTDQYLKLHLRHSELHLSFFLPRP